MLYKMTITQKGLENLVAFLNRTDLKGTEVPAFMEVIQAINTARPIEESQTTQNEDPK